MPINRVYKLADIFQVQTFLNGGLIASRPVSNTQGGGTPAGLGVGFSGLVGTTLKFVLPSAVTVTFVAANGAGGSADPVLPVAQRNPDPYTLLFQDIKKQIEAAIPAVVVTQYSQRLVLIEAAPSGGVTVDKTGTANAILGFGSAANTVGLKYAPPPSTTAPCWTWAYVDSNNQHCIFTLE